ncbi:hypothetical protein ACIQXG_19365 [Lysinibacillus sphaericus]|uniref:hypothetical protein n=1 Tax=Lysinibacillus sphaericus TaxID=1421 RepID=UPI003803E1DB
MREFRKITPTFEAYKFDGDVNKLVEFLGEKNVLVRPNTNAVFVTSLSHGYELLPEGFYVVKNDGHPVIYEPNEFETKFEPIEVFITPINIYCGSSEKEIKKTLEKVFEKLPILISR